MRKWLVRWFYPALFCMGLFASVTHAEDGQRLLLLVSQWYQQAEQDDPDALFNLGQYYRQGIGIEPDLEQAVLFYTRAAELGNTAAQLNLGSLYYFTLPGAPDTRQAKQFWTQAADADHPDAQYMLAVLLLKHFPDESSNASAWLQRAAANGHAEAAQLLQQVQQRASPQQEPLRAQTHTVYSVQLGAFSTREAAQRFAESLSDRLLEEIAAAGLPYQLLPMPNANGVMLYRYLLGEFAKQDEAIGLCERIKAIDLGCYVISLSP